MNTTCAKCGHIRRPDDPAHAAVPGWQCPACGVAYAKAAEAADAQRRPATQSKVIYQARPQPRIGAGRLLLWALMLAGAGYAWHALQQRGGVEAVAARAAGGVSSNELQTLAAKVQPGDIVMYTTATCPTCAQTKAWLGSQGFAYTECDVERDTQCDREFNSLAGRGVPLLVVRGQRMREGFDGHEFLALLRQ